MSLLDHPDDRLRGGHLVQPLQQRLALFGGVLLDDLVEVRIDVRQRGDHQRGQPGHEACR